MIKLVRVSHLRDQVIHLEFSDGSWGDYDLAPLIARGGSMIEPLRSPEFFPRFFIEEGAVAWPNGFDLSPDSLHRRLAEQGRLQRPRAAE